MRKVKVSSLKKIELPFCLKLEAVCDPYSPPPNGNGKRQLMCRPDTQREVVVEEMGSHGNRNAAWSHRPEPLGNTSPHSLYIQKRSSRGHNLTKEGISGRDGLEAAHGGQ